MASITQSVLPAVSSAQGQVYLRLRLDPRTEVVTEMRYAKEVQIVAAQRITPMPNLPNCVLGLLNQRSRVYWIVDLPAMLGLQPLDSKAQSHGVVILQEGMVALGFAVPEIMGVLRLSQETLQEPWKEGKDTMSTYTQGHVTISDDKILTVLDVKSLLCSPLWSTARPN